MAQKWYMNGAKNGDSDSMKNLGRLYFYDLHEPVKGAAYYIALIGTRFSKDKTIEYLTTKWHLTPDQIKQAYDLQKNLDIPKHYTGGID
jgi:TPR repeat protein